MAVTFLYLCGGNRNRIYIGEMTSGITVHGAPLSPSIGNLIISVCVKRVFNFYYPLAGGIKLKSPHAKNVRVKPLMTHRPYRRGISTLNTNREKEKHVF